MKTHPFLALLTLFIAGSASAGEPVTVLGLPLGGKIKPIPKACKDLAPSKYMAQDTCWVYSDAGSQGGRSGALHIPGADKRPGWAAYAEFKGDITKDGTLTQLTVISKDSNQGGEIIDSITTRFGRPTYSASNPPLKWYASWDRPEIGISVLCNLGEKCHTRFTSAEVAADERARLKARMKVDAARPISP